MFLTMFDGKRVNAIVGNRAIVRCPICLVSAHNFNKLFEFTPMDFLLQLGLAILHGEIKAFEHLFHISYRKHIHPWNIKQPMNGAYMGRWGGMGTKSFITHKNF